ncbi:Uncharacterized protein DAT39_007594 [Clarias magur]|uniref:Uncharacterized protein n=1 Tax=Clarias magur TaxID=1594786 RepID=A0A8J4UNN1_CLAMG|nr:Uncharacterized protein DAT39_007594 [Clarias magur]
MLTYTNTQKGLSWGAGSLFFSQIYESELQCMSGRIFSSGMLEPESVFPQLLTTTA